MNLILKFICNAQLIPLVAFICYSWLPICLGIKLLTMPESNLLGITATGIIVINGLEGVAILFGWIQPTLPVCSSSCAASIRFYSLLDIFAVSRLRTECFVIMMITNKIDRDRKRGKLR